MEDEVIKLILKNINPQLASQLRGNGVSSVDALVRLGQQLEKDRFNQKQYELRKQTCHSLQVGSNTSPRNSPSPAPSHSAKTPGNPPLFCWRCRGSHSPASCPQLNSGKYKYKSSHVQAGPSAPASNEAPNMSPSTTSDRPLLGTATQVCPFPFPSPSLTSPQQLLVPISVDSWQGYGLLDTGSSYTLINEKLWLSLGKSTEALKPWTAGPIYLADGGAHKPVGWGEVVISLQTVTLNMSVAVLTPQMLAFQTVLGLDYLFLSGLQIDVQNRSYWFQSDINTRFAFQRDVNAIHDWGPQSSVILFTSVNPLCEEQNPLSGSDLLQQACQNACLSEPERQCLLTQLQNNIDVCTSSLGQTNVLTHTIYLIQEMPIKQKPYRVSPTKQKVMKDLIDEMLMADIIEPSSSAWASPVVLIPKKTGGLRFCVDYRKINSITHADAYPLPTVQEILESLCGAKVFTTLDLNSGYWQVKMSEQSKDKTAFICSQGLFQFKVMPFGLKNAPASFQRLMEVVLGDLRGKICFVYLDDIIIYSASKQQHFLDIDAVLSKLRKANLTVNMKKTHFFRDSLKFLGHIVSATGVEADPEKVQAVQDFPVPRNIKELQRFLGMAGWYHRFVPHFSMIVEPLNALKRKGAKFLWTPQCQASFDALKDQLTSPPVLGHPNFNLPFMVYTDASEVGLGAVLVQQTGLGTEEVLAFASRTLNAAERNYTTTEQECLAIVWALEKWRYYLEGKFFTVVTDHSSLVWIFKTQKPNTRLIRWALRLQEFTFSVEYRKGKYNTVPDALSRAPCNQLSSANPVCFTCLSEKSDNPLGLSLSDEILWKAQQNDGEIQQLYQTIVETGEVIVNSTTRFTILEDKVFRVVKLPFKTLYQVYIPTALRNQLLEIFHDDPLAGHLGQFKTFKRLQGLVYWPNLNQEVKQYIQACQVCQCYKPESRRRSGKLVQTEVSRPWEMLGVDLMGPLPWSSAGNLHLLVFVDYYSRWVEMFALRSSTAEIVAKVLVREVLTRWGVPDYILSDRGSQFVSSVF